MLKVAAARFHLRVGVRVLKVLGAWTLLNAAAESHDLSSDRCSHLFQFSLSYPGQVTSGPDSSAPCRFFRAVLHFSFSNRAE